MLRHPRGGARMRKTWRLVVVAALGIAVLIVLARKSDVPLTPGEAEIRPPTHSDPVQQRDGAGTEVPQVAAAAERGNAPAPPIEPAPPATPRRTAEDSAAPARANGIPRLVDIGADQCIPCKLMAPILEELRGEYAGRMQVDFIDVWKNPHAAQPYRIHAIPTQIFFDESGRELARHQGFMSKEDILSTWKRVGYDFPRGPRRE
jgi:thioredoxin 1